MQAPAPTRATASATLSYGGLLSIPIQLFASVEDRSRRFLKRSEYTRDGRPVGRVNVIRDTDPPEIVDERPLRCIETEHGLVELTDGEIKECFDLPEKEARVLTFLPLHVMGSGRYMPETMLQVRPAKGKQKGTFDPAAAKIFTTLMKAMRQEQVFALVELSLSGQPSYGALLPTGRLYRLLFDDEVREDLPMPDFDVNLEDVERIRSIMEVSPTPPALTNEHRQLLVAYVEKKATEGKTIDKQEIVADVDDLLGALREAVQLKEGSHGNRHPDAAEGK